ncbi:hypothetical protein GYMLUDRAFT_44914 [Collybiopsis luxurians FD-317 M1]|uniref:Uncharacterized protein n=1 Tax=Collybiopsis luxurians FD-317 M1 TaxID=944289 RepID=A0A0D0C9K3_9AGAR|nr:hypothetical protein GYMLUDRAFT_44914 [Collybiopsis luxurians FD-317 M1]
MVHLTDLPLEILSSLPLYIRNIEDFTNAASTCRTLYHAFGTASPNCILRLAAASPPLFAQLHPHFLIAVTVRQVSDWALESEENTRQLRLAFQGGADGLFELCIEKAGLTLEDIRRFHSARYSIFDPFADTIDQVAGQQWYQSESGQWRLRTRDAINRAAYQILIYGELFASSMQTYLEPEKNLPTFDLDVRLDYIKYCISDWTYRSDSGIKISDRLPSANRYEEFKESDKKLLRHILTCSRWVQLWQAVSSGITPDFEEEWKQKLWVDAIQIQGIDGMRVLAARHSGESCRGKLLRIRSQVEKLREEDRPATLIAGTQPRASISYAPDFPNEICIACGSSIRA